MSIPPPPPLPPLPGTKKRDPNKTPQELVSEFWDKFFSKKPGKVTSIFPRALYATLLPPSQPKGLSSARNAQESYEAAAKDCRERVRRIVRECNRTNEKFTDPDFDIEADNDDNCLNGLVRDAGGSFDDAGLPVSAGQLRRSLNTLVDSNVLGPGAQVPVDIGQMRNFINDSNPWAAFFGGGDDTSRGARHGARGPNAGPSGGGPGQGRPQPAGQEEPKPSTQGGKRGVRGGEVYSPGSIHRVDWIFESPQFTVDGFAASDIKQGGNGDCWWLAAVATIAHRRDLMGRVCVARDEECGVYGFVFQRDGEWVGTVVDDNLYLAEADFDHYGDTYDSTGRRAREHRKRYQTGSEALYFAKCADKNETWLPLLEKAYAKVHGDYEAISGGWSGEAVEDMTGGVTTTVCTNRVLKKDKLWKELAFMDGEFVFALSAIGTGWDWQKGGLALGHAYSILQAREEVDEEGNKVRLVQIRNPWGERAWNGIGEWNGPWSDGSKEWTPYWLKKLGHKFGDDGIFWMSYQDMLETFRFMHRTRLFDEKWTVVQQWTSVNIGWVSGYLNTKFLVEVKKAGMVVFVLTQLDERYFLGFEGQYEFQLHFLLRDENGKAGDHICRVRPVHDWENRSVSCEVDLEPGRYEVVPKITATRDPGKKMVEDVVKEWAEKNPQKLRQVGMQYDLAHAKGGVPDEDELLVKKREEEKAKKKAKKEKAKRKRKAEKEKAKKEKTLRVVMVDENKGTDTTTTAAVAAASSEKDDQKKAEEKKSDDKKTEEKKAEEKKNDDTAKDDTSKKEETKVEDKPAEEPAKEVKKAEASTSDSSTEGKPTPGSSTTSSAAEEKKPEDEKKADTEEKKDAVVEAAAEEEADVEEDSDDSDEEEKEDEPKPGDELEDGPPPWNAVSVIGLRVYATDPSVSITLVKPSSPEETSSLTTDSQPAGATS